MCFLFVSSTSPWNFTLLNKALLAIRIYGTVFNHIILKVQCSLWDCLPSFTQQRLLLVSRDATNNYIAAYLNLTNQPYLQEMIFAWMVSLVYIWITSQRESISYFSHQILPIRLCNVIKDKFVNEKADFTIAFLFVKEYIS